MTRLTYGEMRTRTEALIDEQIKERVLAGLEVLQEAYGDEWVEKIDCAELNLRFADCCVLGQVCGSYDAGLEKLDPDGKTEWASLHGFSILPWNEREGLSRTQLWTILDDAWHRVLCDKDVSETQS